MYTSNELRQYLDTQQKAHSVNYTPLFQEGDGNRGLRGTRNEMGESNPAKPFMETPDSLDTFRKLFYEKGAGKIPGGGQATMMEVIRGDRREELAFVKDAQGRWPLGGGIDVTPLNKRLFDASRRKDTAEMAEIGKIVRGALGSAVSEPDELGLSEIGQAYKIFGPDEFGNQNKETASIAKGLAKMAEGRTRGAPAPPPEMETGEDEVVENQNRSFENWIRAVRRRGSRLSNTELYTIYEREYGR